MRTRTRSGTKPRASGTCCTDVLSFPIDRMFSSEGPDRKSFMGVILEKMPHGIIVCAADGRIIYTNSAARQLLQLDRIAAPWSIASCFPAETCDSDDRQTSLSATLLKAMRGETICQQECKLIGGAETLCYILCSALPISSDSQTVGCFGMLTDITAQKDKEWLLRQEALRSERRRIAAEIHDTVSQGLNALRFQLHAAEAEIASDPAEAAVRLRKAQELARTSSRDARSCMWTLCQEALPGSDLASSLSTVARRLFDGTPVKLELALQKALGRLSAEMHHALVNVGKEALTNALRHAQASTVRVELLCLHDQIRLSVDDDGRGFVPGCVRSLEHGFGLVGMKTRLTAFGGSVAVETRRGIGTRVTAYLPLTPSVLQATA